VPRDSVLGSVILAVALLGAVVLASAGLGYRIGLWALRTALGILGASVFVAGAAIVLSLIGLARAAMAGSWSAALVALLALLIGGGTASVPLAMRRAAQSVPFIHDITTDLDRPPEFAALRAVPAFSQTPLWVQSERKMAGVALYASLFEPNIVRLDLHQLPASHRQGPILLNVERFLDLPQAVAMAAERSQVILYQDGESGWEFPADVAKQLNWGEKKFQIRKLAKE